MKEGRLESRLWGALQRPEYVLHPGQVYRRLARRNAVGDAELELAWGLPISVDPTCCIGRDIVNLGVFDKIVPEATMRLLDRGETAVDVGANVGQNTSVMALTAGASGTVHSIEPHPRLYAVLERNVARWRTYSLATMAVHRLALGNANGSAALYEPDGFSNNSGCGTMIRPANSGATHAVQVRRLDELLAPDARVGVLKIDVEGLELDVLQGATALLGHGRIRDILYEDYSDQPSPVRQFLEGAGYVTFHLRWSFWGPLATARPQDDELGAANFLATLDPDRAVVRLRARGWRCLRRRVRSRSQSS